MLHESLKIVQFAVGLSGTKYEIPVLEEYSVSIVVQNGFNIDK